MTGGTIDNVAIGNTPPSTGIFTTLTALSVGTGLTVTNNATVGGTLGVTGATTLGGPAFLAATGLGLSVLNNATIGGTLGVIGATTLAALTSGNNQINGTLNVTGVSTLGSATTSSTISALTISGGGAGGPTLSALGGTNASISINSNGNGSLILGNSNGVLFTFGQNSTIAVANRLAFTATTAGNSPSISVGGPSSDTNVGLTFKIKGTGTYSFQNASSGLNNVEFGNLSLGKGQVRVYSGAGSTAQADIQVRHTLTGIITSGQQSYFNIWVPGDVVGSTNSGGALSIFQILHSTDVGASGNRWMLDVSSTAGAAGANLQ
jgi:fibronectin-binding autotransporter adhesin